MSYLIECKNSQNSAELECIINTTNPKRARFNDCMVEIWVEGIEPKPRTKTVYEPMLGLAVSEAFRAMEDDGDVYVNCCDGSFEGMEGCIINLANAINDDSVIYRKVEKEIDWQVEVESFRKSSELKYYDMEEALHFTKDHCMTIDFVKMCHLVAELTDKPE